MRRWSSIAPILVLLMLALPAWPQVAAADDSAGTAYVWDSDRVVNSTLNFYENDTLEIAAGANISFEPGADGDNGTIPMLAVMGNLWINGTSNRPVRLAADESLWENGSEPDCLQVFNDARADRLSVRNASFTDIVVWLYFSGGEFRDCAFDRCDLNLVHSAISFVNCTFIYSTLGTGQFWQSGSEASLVSLSGCRFDGRDPSSHPPLPYESGLSGTDDLYQRTAIELQGPVDLRDCSISGYEAGITAGLNSSSVQNCTVRDCLEGIIMEGQTTEERADIRGCTVQNCTEFGIFSMWGLRLSDSVIGDCGEAGVYAYGALLMANCTVYNCTTGVSLYGGGWEAAGDWLLSGNRILGCGGYAVRAEGGDVDITGNRFEDGNITNAFGRLLVSKHVRLDLTDPTGRALSGTCDVDWTDALGHSNAQTSFPGDSLLLDVYMIDNAGERADLFPYSLRVRHGATENRTVVEAGQDALTMVLPVLPDLVPVYLEPDSENIVAGQEVRFLVRVENLGTGSAAGSTVVFMVDGKNVDHQTVSGLAIRGRESVYSDPWRATPGRHTVEAVLDPGPEPGGFLAENNESNNNLTVEFSVSGPGAGNYRPLTATENALLDILKIVWFAAVFIIIAIGYKRFRDRQKRISGPAPAKGLEPFPATALEPTPATITNAPRIKCPKCGRLNEVVSRQRPLEIKCELCGASLKLVR